MAASASAWLAPSLAPHGINSLSPSSCTFPSSASSVSLTSSRASKLVSLASRPRSQSGSLMLRSHEGGSEPSMGRRQANFMFGALLLAGFAPAAGAKSSTELEREVAILEKEVEASFKEAVSVSTKGKSSFQKALKEGDSITSLFEELKAMSEKVAASFNNLKELGQSVAEKLSEEEEALGEAAVQAYEQAEEASMVRKNSEKTAELFAKGDKLRSQVKVKVQKQKDWQKSLEELKKAESLFQTSLKTNQKAVSDIKSAMANVTLSASSFTKAVSEMNNVKLFNEAGSVPNAQSSLATIKNAVELNKKASNLAKQSVAESQRANKILADAMKIAVDSGKVGQESLNSLTKSNSKLKEKSSNKLKDALAIAQAFAAKASRARTA
eukprot:751828-Hanusia_phi.AAC.2